MMENYIRYRDGGQRKELYLLVIAGTIEEVVEISQAALDLKSVPPLTSSVKELNELKAELSDAMGMFNILSDILEEMDYGIDILRNFREVGTRVQTLMDKTPDELFQHLITTTNSLAKLLSKMARFGPDSPQPSSGLLTRHLVREQFHELEPAVRAYLIKMGHPSATLDHTGVARKMEKFDKTLIESFTSEYTVIK